MIFINLRVWKVRIICVLLCQTGQTTRLCLHSIQIAEKLNFVVQKILPTGVSGVVSIKINFYDKILE